MDEPLDLKVVNGTVVLGDGRYRAGVGVKDGKVVVLAPDEFLPEAKETVNARGNYILPGIVDPEAHPGCYVPFEYDMASESRAAACAGVTTWGIQAPVTRLGTEPFKEVVAKSDVVSFNESFPSGRDVIERVSHVDAYFTYMLETDQHAREIPQYAEEHGVTSFKLYLQTRSMKGMADDADTNWPSRRAGLGTGIDDGTVYLVMEEVGRLGNPGIVHIHPENWEIGRIFEERLKAAGRTDFGAWTDRSPDFLEAQHARAYAYLAQQTPGNPPLYLQHCTTRLTFDEVVKARAEGLTIYAQTGPPGSGQSQSTAGVSTCLCGAATTSRRSGWHSPRASWTASDPTTWSAGSRPPTSRCTTQTSGICAPDSAEWRCSSPSCSPRASTSTVAAWSGSSRCRVRTRRRPPAYGARRAPCCRASMRTW